VHEADLIVLEVSMGAAGAISRREAVEAFRLENAVDGIPVQMRQEMGDDEGEVVEREAGGAAQRTDDGALLLTGLPRQPVGPGRAVLAVSGSALAPLADGLGRDAVTLGQHAGTLVRAGDLGADSRRRGAFG